MAKLLSKKIISPEIVYDLSVETNHNFYANNILVHNCANKKSSQGNHLLKLDSDYKIAATGTLITNNPASAYLPLAWTDNDKSVLGTFRPQYEIQDEHNRVVGYKNLEVLHEEIESCSLRRTLTEVRDDMPPKTVTYEYIYLDKAHRDFYENIKKGVIDDATKVELNNSNLLALTTRLRQAAVCPMILTDTAIKSTKLERCCELVDELISQDEKVVILSNFVEPVKQLATMLKQYNPLLCLGELKDDVVARNNKLFQEDPAYKLIIGSHQRMGTGLNFNAASYLIMLDSPWTYASFSQSSDRIWRVNNTRPAHIKVLVDSDTIDERVMELVETKKELGEILVDGKEVKMTKSMADELRKIVKEL